MLSLTIQNDVQVLDIKLFQLYAVLAVEALLKEGIIAIDVVENLVCIFLFASSENYNFIPLNKLLQYILHVRAQSHLNFCPFELKLECRFKPCGYMPLEFSSDERLIHVKYNEFFFCLGAQLERFEHDLVLVILRLFVWLKFVAVSEQID